MGSSLSYIMGYCVFSYLSKPISVYSLHFNVTCVDALSNILFLIHFHAILVYIHITQNLDYIHIRSNAVLL